MYLKLTQINWRKDIWAKGVKDDFRSVLRSLNTLMFINIISSHSMESPFAVSFKIWKERTNGGTIARCTVQSSTKNWASRISSLGYLWWNANRCYSLRSTCLIFEALFKLFFQQLHFVMSHMRQNEKTLESAQYGLELSTNWNGKRITAHGCNSTGKLWHSCLTKSHRREI